MTEIHWGSSVPENWRGIWSNELLTVPERTNYTRTSAHMEVLEFISKLTWRSEYMHVVSMFTSDLRRSSPLVILSKPRVTKPEEVNKPVVYLQGNIHPPEAEGKECLLMVMRDLAMGKRDDLIENLVILIAPDFNPDGTETWDLRPTSAFCGTPHIQSNRHDAKDYDINRDAIKMESKSMKGLYANVLNKWDPIITLDIHSMGRVMHAYSNLYAPSYTPTAHPGPRL